mgnify:CR=1 FL=1
MGIDHLWSEVADTYANVNKMFGDVIKVTPTSKVVGDLALFMVANGLAADAPAVTVRAEAPAHMRERLTACGWSAFVEEQPNDGVL